MNNQKFRNLRDALLEYSIEIYDYVRKNIEKTKFKPIIYNSFVKTEVTKFEYDIEGARPATTSKPVEYIDGNKRVMKFKEDILEFSLYQKILSLLKENYPNENEIKLQSDFIDAIIKVSIQEEKIDNSIIKRKLDIFFKQLNDELISSYAKIELKDLVVLTPTFEFQVNSTILEIKQTSKEDFEKIEYSFAIQRDLFYPPDAILNLTCEVRNPRAIQILIEQVLSIIILYQVGSVRYIRYELSSDSIISTMNPIFPVRVGNRQFIFPTLKKVIITPDNVKELIGFLKRLSNLLPKNFYINEEKKVDYLSIAFLRYKDSIFHGKTDEERIANAIMGLEAIYLRGTDPGELSFKLRSRIAKLLGILSIDKPAKIVSLIKEAYEIRSKYVHGGTIGAKNHKRINEKFGSIKEFSITLLDYLRKSILIAIYLNMKKETIHTLIDESFIDIEKSHELRINLLSKIPDMNGLQTEKSTIIVYDSDKNVISKFEVFTNTNYTEDDFELKLDSIKQRLNISKSALLTIESKK